MKVFTRGAAKENKDTARRRELFEVEVGDDETVDEEIEVADDETVDEVAEELPGLDMAAVLESAPSGGATALPLAKRVGMAVATVLGVTDAGA